MGRTCLGIVLLCLVAAVSAKSLRIRKRSVGFAWHDCGSDPNRPFKVTSLSMSPSPVKLPGTLNLDFTGQVTREMGMAAVELDIKREIGFSWFRHNITVPCAFNIGSCTYDNSCTLVSRMENEDWLGISGNVGRQIREILTANNIPTTCPLPAQTMNVQNAAFQLPAIPSILSTFSGGTYHATVRISNSANRNEEYACVYARIIVD